MEIQTEHWPELLRRITIEMTKRCDTMSLEEVREGICLCSKLLSKVMPSLKTIENARTGSVWSAAEAMLTGVENAVINERLRSERNSPGKEFEDSSEVELNEWSIIELKRSGDVENDNEESMNDKSFETCDDRSENGAVDSAERETTEETTLIGHAGQGSTIRNVYEEDIGKDGIKDTPKDEYNGVLDVNGVASHALLHEFESSNELDSKSGQSGSSNEANDVDDVFESRHVEEQGKALTQQTKHLFQPSLIQACVKFYQNFFARFVVERVLRNNERAQEASKKDCYLALQANGLFSKNVWTEIKKGLDTEREKLMEEPALEGTFKATADKSITSARGLRSTPLSKNCAEAFIAACKLLLELSCFPVCCGKDSELEKIGSGAAEGKYSFRVFGPRRPGRLPSISCHGKWLVRRTWDQKVESSSPGRYTHVVFLGKTLNSHSASLHPGV